MQGDSSRPRGRPPKATSDPLGSLIRERRLAKNWSLERLAQEVGLEPGATSFLSRIEQGEKVPSFDVAERLAECLDLPRSPLVEWAERARYMLYSRKSLKDRPDDWSPFPSAEWIPGPSRIPEHRRRSGDDDIPVYEERVDPTRGEPRSYVRRDDIQKFLSPATRRALVNPFIAVISDRDFERLRRPVYGADRPTYALVSRRPVQTIDPEEPYAIRAGGRLLLAYVGWDGHDVFILPAPGKSRLRSASAEGLEGLQKRIVGQVLVLMDWHPPTAETG
jgi:transcriptional regulator with XRE-family HTH domain